MEHFVKVTVAKASSMQYGLEYLVTYCAERLLVTTSSFVGSSTARPQHANQVKPKCFTVQDMMDKNSCFYSQQRKFPSWVLKWKETPIKNILKTLLASNTWRIYALSTMSTIF